MLFFRLQIIERHFTLNKNQKGTDHQSSLEPKELRKMIQNIRQIENESIECFADNKQIIRKLQTFGYRPNELTDVEQALQSIDDNRIIQPCEMACWNKLGKSLVYQRNLAKGHCLTFGDICAKVSEPHGISAEEYYNMLGKTLTANVDYDDIVKDEHVF